MHEVSFTGNTVSKGLYKVRGTIFFRINGDLVLQNFVIEDVYFITILKSSLDKTIKLRLMALTIYILISMSRYLY